MIKNQISEQTMTYLSLFLFILLVINIPQFSFAQTIGLDKSPFTIHSPNVTSLGQFGEYPVDVSTGVPSINIPLYTIKSGKIEVPVSLSYHASGIKVDQEASFVGLGWVLNTGGVINRLVKDKVDEQSYGFLTNGSQLPDYNSIEDIGPVGMVGNNSYLKNSVAIGKDNEPDLFNISAIGLNGEFCLDNTGKFVSIGFEPLKYDINLIDNLLIITDNNGTVYRFGKSLDNTSAYETTSTYYSEVNNGSVQVNTFPGLPQFTSSWHLTEIISADQADTISFKYTISHYGNFKAISATRFIIYAGSPIGSADAIGRNFDGTSILSSSTNIYNVQVIDKIVFRHGHIQFVTANDRIDQSSGVSGIPSKTRITGFIVYNNQNQILKKVNFDNSSYFDRTAIGSNIDNSPTISAERKKSLKLNGVKFYDKSDKFINQYRFTYDETPLPPRNTASQDFWGYFNGKNNSSIIPQTFYIDASYGTPSYIGEDRNSDFSFMKAASLKKIYFPTGGYTEYEFDSNYYLKQEQSQGKEEINRNVSIYAINRFSQCDPEIVPENATADAVTEFEITEDLSNNSIGKLVVTFSDYKNNVGKPMSFKMTDLTGGGSWYFEHIISERTQQKVVQQDIILFKGHRYRLEAKTNGVTGSNTSICYNSPTITASLGYKCWVISSSQNIFPVQAGGLRVKNISTFDNSNKLTSKKSYEYGDTLYGPNKVSAGTLITDPSKNFYIYPMLYAHNNGTQTLEKVLWFTSDSQVELGFNKGCPVDYKKVTEKVISYEDSNVSNGKVEYFFSETPGFVEYRSSIKYPYTFMNYPSWKSSELREVISYKQSDDLGYLPLKKIKYDYVDKVENRIKTLRIIDFQPDIYGATQQYNGSWLYLGDNSERFYYYNHFVSCGKRVKNSETIFDYINGQATLTSEKTFTYNSVFDLKKEQVVNSKNETLERTIKYTGDLNYSILLGKNMISLPVLEENLINGKVKNGALLKYDDIGNIYAKYVSESTIPILPIDYTTVSAIPSHYKERETYTYNLIGNNINEIKNIDQSSTTYLWDYAYQYPVAEVKNSTNVNVAFSSFEADGKGNWSFTGTPSDDLTALTGTKVYNLTNGAISKSGLTSTTEYIVSYWTKNTSALLITGTQGTVVKIKSFNGWNLYEHTIKGVTSVSISGTGLIDELRLYPSDAQMTTYTYKPLVGITSSTDAKGQTSYYEYDDFQRLKWIKDQEGNIIKTMDYHYQNQ